MSSAPNSVEACRGDSASRAILFPLIACAVIVVSGCRLKPQGRCGIADMCDPVVMADPFPDDRCVPPKGVDCGNYGYVTTSWRVLNPRQPECCTLEVPCCEPIPVGAADVDFQAILKEPEQNASLAVLPMEIQSATSDFGLIQESTDVVRQTLVGERGGTSKLR